MGEIILQDEFGWNISRTIQKYDYKNNLEIGSWDGSGSTQCFVDGMDKVCLKYIEQENIMKTVSLQCIEINVDRFVELQKNTKRPYIRTYCMSSIDRQHFLPQSFDEIWNSPFNKLLHNPLGFSKELVQTWYEEDLPRIGKVGFLNSYHRKKEYDAVLIDGSEFTGYSEFKLLKDSTKCFFLDDVFWAYKNAQSYQELAEDDDWILLAESSKVRNGYAIFKRK